MAKLAIVEEREEDKYEHVTTLKCWNCDAEQGRDISNIVNPSVCKLSNVFHLAWALIPWLPIGIEEDYRWSDAILDVREERGGSGLGGRDYRLWTYVNFPARRDCGGSPIRYDFHTCVLYSYFKYYSPWSIGLAHCTQCDLKENLWLCLTCGSLGCGRQMWGGVGGNGHAMKHFEETKHPVCVKLGTITPEGTAGTFTNLIPKASNSWLQNGRYLLLCLSRVQNRPGVTATSFCLWY